MKKFKKEDIFHNTIKTYPNCNFLVYDRKIYYNNKGQISGACTPYTPNLPAPGYINLYEMEVDRATSQVPYPFLMKESSLTSFKTISTTDFNSDFSYGDKITGSYPLLSKVRTDYYSQGQDRPQLDALRTSFDEYKKNSVHYAYSSSLGDKGDQALRLIAIPNMFYGSSIKKGSVTLSFYTSGTLLAQLQDYRRNGDLVQTGPTGSLGSGSVAGSVLYSEGFICLTGSWDLSATHTETYIPAGAVAPKWIYAFNTGSDAHDGNIPSSSFGLNFEGTNYVNTITMLCHAKKGELNFSNNPTWIEYGQSGSIPMTSSISYVESDKLLIKNTVKSPWQDPTGSFKKQVFISKVGIFDSNRNLIAIAKMATPVRKRDTDSYTFKLKIDI